MSWVLSAFADEAGGTIDEQVKALNRAGIRHIDLRNVDGHNIAALPVDLARTVRRKLDAAGIKVAMFGSPLGKIDIAEDFETDLAKLRHMGQLKDVLGCAAIRIFSYYNRKTSAPADRWQAESLRRLKALAAEARKLGMVLYHENESHIFGDHPAQNKVLADELRNGETFRIIFDFSNFNMGGDDVWAAWELLRDKVDAFHLKDSDKSRQHVPLGQGAGHVQRIFADALKRGWKGPLTLEPHLAHSKAVMATGPSGQKNEQYEKMPTAESFHVATQAAQAMLKQVGVPMV